MSQPIFDPLDVAVLTRHLVPWTNAVLPPDTVHDREELMQCTMRAEAWRRIVVQDPARIELVVREARREYIASLVREWVARLRAAFHKPVQGAVEASLAHGEHA